MSLQPGFQPIPGYLLTQPLGAGAFGEVWEARQSNGSVVACKFLDCRKRPSSQIAGEVRILRTLASLNHPHIIPLRGVHASSKYLILIMERADGSLADLHRAYREHTKGNLPPDHALELLDQAAEALDFLSSLRLTGLSTSRGLQHCDVKPSNLLLVGNKLKVADFGLCGGSGWYGHTGWKGTHPYAAPELFNGTAAPGTDQYALAITFCELVMGDRPFWKNQDYNSPPSDFPIDFTKLRDKETPVLAKALHRFPSSRWPSCKGFLQALRSAVDLTRRGQSTRIFPRGLRGSLRSGQHRTVAVPAKV